MSRIKKPKTIANKTTKRSAKIANKTTKRSANQIDPRLARVHVLIDEIFANGETVNVDDVIKQLIEPALASGMSSERVKDLFTLIMSDDTIGQASNEERRNEIVKVADYEHSLNCACCRARSVEQ